MVGKRQIFAAAAVALGVGAYLFGKKQKSGNPNKSGSESRGCDDKAKKEASGKETEGTISPDEEFFRTPKKINFTMTERWPDDPVDGAGLWVPRNEFRGRKSFGYFECESCSTSWVSAHAYPKFKQGCKSTDCKRVKWVYPKLLWVNDDTDSRRDGEPHKNTKPHLKRHCGACNAGVCDAL